MKTHLLTFFVVATAASCRSTSATPDSNVLASASKVRLTASMTSKQVEEHEKSIASQLPNQLYELWIADGATNPSETGRSSFVSPDCAKLDAAQGYSQSPNTAIEKEYADLYGFKTCKARHSIYSAFGGKCTRRLSCSQPIVSNGKDTYYYSVLDKFDSDVKGDAGCFGAAIIQSIDGKAIEFGDRDDIAVVFKNLSGDTETYYGCRFITVVKNIPSENW